MPCSWWAVSALAAAGRHAEATARADALCQALPALISEQFDPATGESLGNTPLLWSHMELVRALYLLDTSELRRRWGRAGIALSTLVRTLSGRAGRGNRRARRRIVTGVATAIRRS